MKRKRTKQHLQCCPPILKQVTLVCRSTFRQCWIKHFGAEAKCCGAPSTEVVAQDTWSIRVNVKRACITRYVAYIAYPVICLKLTQIYSNSRDWVWGRGHFPLTFEQIGTLDLLFHQYFVMKDNVVAKIFTMSQVQVRLNHVVICDVHRDMLSELSRQEIVKEFERSSDARWRAFSKIWNIIPMYMANNGMI